MATSLSSRFQLQLWSADSDEITRLQFDTSHKALDSLGAKFFVGSGVPPTGAIIYVGSFYFDTAATILYFYTGTLSSGGVFTVGSWVKINEMATTVTAVTAGGSSVVGTSFLKARADHTHGLSRGVATPIAVGTTAVIGTSGNVSDASHVHILAAGSVNSSAILASNVVITDKILDDAVTSAKLADDASIDANRAVTTNHIKDLAITTGKIANTSVTLDKIANTSLIKSKINTSVAGGPGVYYNGQNSTGGSVRYGTAAPTGVANEGDLYFQYVN